MQRHDRADSHLHLFEHGFHPGRDDEPDATHYRRVADQHNITRAVVVGYEGQVQFAGNNDYILGQAASDSRLIPLAFVDCAIPPGLRTFGSLRSKGFAGFSMYLPDQGPSLDAWPDEAINALDAAGGLLSVNASAAALDRAADRLAWLGRTEVLLSHLGGPGAALRGATFETATARLTTVLRLARRPNVNVKLSGLYAVDRDYPHHGATGVVQALLEGIGARKLVWGSDFSPILDAVPERHLASIPPWVERLLDPDEARDVCGGTLLAIIERAAQPLPAAPAHDANPPPPTRPVRADR